MKIITSSFLLLSVFTKALYPKQNKLNIIMKHKEIKLHTNYSPKTENQIKYNKILDLDNEFLLSVVGPPGTGKTLLACVKAIEKLKDNKINKIIITRPTTPVEEDIGFLPGNIDKKMNPWIRPIYDVFLDYFSKQDLNSLFSEGKIEISPLGFMRGRTFKNSFIIADEMQNCSPKQMLMLLTRIGVNSKIVITGDLKQSDIATRNGLEDLVSRLDYKLPESFYLVRMDDTDIQRSNIVSEVLKLYDNDNYKNNDASLIPKYHVSKFYKENIPLKEVKSNENILISNAIREITNNSTNNSSNNNKNRRINDDAAMIPLKDLSKHHDKKIF